MKDATSVYNLSTFSGEDMLRYNLPHFLSETHLLCVVSSIQGRFLGKDRLLAIFLEATPLFCLCLY